MSRLASRILVSLMHTRRGGVGSLPSEYQREGKMGMSGTRNLKVWAALLMAALAASVLMAAVVLASPAWAATYTVINNADSGSGSLRQAIIDANTNTGVADTINFDPSVSGQTITLTSSQLPTITDVAGLTIDGGSADIIISGANQHRVFEVGSGIGSGARLTLSNLTVANGAVGVSEGGGGIRNIGSTLEVSNSTISGNSAYAGGGIYNEGGGTTLEVSNSTISGNSADPGFGGGGIQGSYGGSTLKNTIVANSPSASGGSCAGTITDGGYNLDSDNTCGFGTNNNSLSGVDPMLGVLADNGGPTKTHALLASSPAIDKGNSFGATTDQRGVARPQGAASDIGAFESESTVIEDTIKPRVSAATPTGTGTTGTGIGRGTNVAATFSEKMSPASLTKSTFKLFKVTSSGTTQVTNVTVTPSSDGLKATLDPYGTSSSLLAARTKYKAVVTTGARDLAGNALDQNSTRAGNQQKSWTFTTKG